MQIYSCAGKEGGHLDSEKLTEWGYYVADAAHKQAQKKVSLEMKGI